MNIASSWSLVFKRYLSLDTLLLALLVLPNLEFNQLASALVMGAVILYALVDIAFELKTEHDDERAQLRKHLAFTLKFFLLTLIIAIIVVVPTLFYVINRPHGEPDSHLHDGAFQTEVALRYLASGKNPYSETYVGSGLESYILTDAPENPALYNFVYLPFLLMFSLPFYIVSSATLGWFDQRLVYLPVFIISLFLLPQVTKEPSKKLVLLALFGLNFYTVEFLHAGRNDILVFAFLLASVLFLRSGRVSIGSLLLGLACAIKPSAWFFIPFFSIFVTRSLSWRKNLALWTKPMVPLWLAVVLAVAPFLIWDAGALLRSTVAYTLGFGGTAVYPIRGYGWGTLLLSFGMISSPLAQFPFWIFQLAASLPVLVVALRHQFRDNTINTALFGYAAFFTVFMFFSRFFQNNYFHFALLVIFLALFMDPFQSNVAENPEQPA